MPVKFPRIRLSDVLQPAALARNNLQYRNHLIYGATWRADVITALETQVGNAHQIATLIGCQKQLAKRICKDFSLAQEARAER